MTFGQTVYLWRMERGWTQAELARRTRMPRPRLSGIERGAVEPTLRTIRRLAGAMEVSPGTLVDGALPRPWRRSKWSRAALEQIVTALIDPTATVRDEKRHVVGALRRLFTHRLHASWVMTQRPARASVRRLHRDWLVVTGLLEPSELASLVARVEKRLVARR